MVLEIDSMRISELVGISKWLRLKSKDSSLREIQVMVMGG